ncbi:hypothetical protein [Empedobacter brevis]|uniref:hypothetical protein n=1 Tax=Empedobacter brevis TaxID=247 RepID=UPI00131FAE68|nr:hypothetical protein [Empedobacter brevis]QHC86414.1 hypothetical protein AS589_17310 [Empedobacter brevis]
MNKLFVIIILTCLFSCSKRDVKQSKLKENNIESDTSGLGTLIRWDTLFISARFDECGEFGGHKEVLEIFKRDKKIYLTYKKNTIDCDKVDEISQVKLSFVKEIELSTQHQKAIKEYFYYLLQNKIDEGYHAHSGNEFKVLKADSTFFINVYDNNPNNPEIYNSLLKKLSLK